MCYNVTSDWVKTKYGRDKVELCATCRDGWVMDDTDTYNFPSGCKVDPMTAVDCINGPSSTGAWPDSTTTGYSFGTEYYNRHSGLECVTESVCLAGAEGTVEEI